VVHVPIGQFQKHLKKTIINKKDLGFLQNVLVGKVSLELAKQAWPFMRQQGLEVDFVSNSQ